SSAMPHKMNTRSTERINGFQIILGGHLHMVSGLVGDQWFEGDVSCSVVRRVALPDSMFAFDGMIETMLHVLDDMGIYEAVIQNELERYMPFLATTTLLMESVQRGAGREQVHEAIKEHAVASALSMREQGKVENDLAERLGDDDRLPLSVEEIDAILRKSEDFVGLAREQADGFVASVDALAQKYPGASRVEKSRLL
ncbi:MAG TPA: adenylosuccinate lyase, partial [Candidatus Latescibacteria bacterium]|nr:adenylosuccinate lyase [Candidatus Latescibacterota bacterium]